MGKADQCSIDYFQQAGNKKVGHGDRRQSHHPTGLDQTPW